MRKKLLLELERETHKLVLAFARHDFVLKNGTPDSLWPDGTNANILRNLCQYHKGRIIDLCRQLGEKLPAVALRSVPPAQLPTFSANNKPLMRKGA